MMQTKLTTIGNDSIERLFEVHPTALTRMILIHATMAPGRFFSVCTVTAPKMAKEKSNPYGGGRIQKMTEVNSQSFKDYEGIVKRRRVAEGLEPEFVADYNKIGTRVFIDGEWSPFLVNFNTGRVYCQYINRSARIETFYVDGNAVGPVENPEWNIYHAPVKAAEDTKQGLSDDLKVKVNSVGIENIAILRSDGNEIVFEIGAIPEKDYVTVLE